LQKLDAHTIMNGILRVFGHPVHAMSTDLPVALLGTSLLWDAIGFWRDEPVWWAIGYWNLALGLIAAVAAATAGTTDYVSLSRSDHARPTAFRHLLLMSATILAYTASLLVRVGPAAVEDAARYAVLALEMLGVALLSIGAWHGGQLVFHFGVGQDRRTTTQG
jgi:uncharacterized membrane protein